MKRRNFFKAASYGTVSLAMAASCKSYKDHSGDANSGLVNSLAAQPHYRKGFEIKDQV